MSAPAAAAPLAVALDTPDLATAARWARDVAPHVALLKVGLELFGAHGHAVAGLLDGAPAGGPRPGLFLDLKLHDIPATVTGAVRAVSVLRPRLLTVHASGGSAMVRAAADAAALSGGATTIAAVTVLTSLDEADLRAVGLAGPALDAARRLAALAVAAGAGAVVCSPQEVVAVRTEVGPAITLITPGVRPRGSDPGDQRRVTTPAEALARGADLLVVGRPITASPDPSAAVRALAAQLAAPRSA